MGFDMEVEKKQPENLISWLRPQKAGQTLTWINRKNAQNAQNPLPRLILRKRN
jgi:hypothetical protein